MFLWFYHVLFLYLDSSLCQALCGRWCELFLLPPPPPAAAEPARWAGLQGPCQAVSGWGRGRMLMSLGGVYLGSGTSQRFRLLQKLLLIERSLRVGRTWSATSSQWRGDFCQPMSKFCIQQRFDSSVERQIIERQCLCFEISSLNALFSLTWPLGRVSYRVDMSVRLRVCTFLISCHKIEPIKNILWIIYLEQHQNQTIGWKVKAIWMTKSWFLHH